MKEQLINMLIGLVVQMLTPELLKQFADMVLDFIEEKVANSENTIDDKTILPICNMIRSSFDIPDND